MSAHKIRLTNTLCEYEVDEKPIIRIAEKIFDDENFMLTDVDIILVNDQYIRDLNNRFLNKNATTDVISFNLEQNRISGVLEGEVYANLEQISRQAEEYGVSFENELHRIVIHGLLHLCEYDDKSDLDRQYMTEKEDHYLSLI
ncbi:MAG: rRNA maturation RNase YbeY [bacterium]|nr:rRNA maturation RNase YbeY [bacterium]